jgi:hypothetical protein
MNSKFLLLPVCLCLLLVKLPAQNVGINTTSPQATLDVRGTQRTGGTSNYITYDSATGRIQWIGASLFTPVSQQIIRHSASSEGLYAGGGKLDYRNSTGIPVFYSDWTNGNGYFAGNVGVGITTPLTKLHVFNGASGATPFAFSPLVVENNGHTYINILSPAANEGAILFGQPGSSANGVIMYNNTSTPNGFQFRNNNNITRMVIDNAGNMGIGTLTPNAPLTFPPSLGKKITLYPGASGDVGFGVQGNLFQMFSDNSNADIAFGFGTSASFNERFRMRANGEFVVNGNAGNNGQVLTSSGPGLSPGWTDASSFKTLLYEAIIPAFTLTDAANQITIDVPVTLYTNSIITASVSVDVSTAGFLGCNYGDFSIIGFRLGSGLIRTMGRFNTACGTPTSTLATGELPMWNSGGTPGIFGPGVNTVRIMLVKITGTPDISRSTASTTASIVVKVIPQ